MKNIVKFALAAVLLATGQGSVFAQNGHTVYAERHSREVWIERVSDDLSDNLGYPNTPTSGFASVRFECGPDGNPTNIAVINHSNSRFDAPSVRAVHLLRNLHPLPDNVVRGQVFQANLIFATNEYELTRQARLLQQAEATRLASSHAEQTVLVLSSSARGPG